MLPAVQYAINYNPAFIVHFVVNRVREAARQKTVITKNLRVDAAVESQGVNVGEDRIKKIVSQALALLFIKCAPGSQIIASGRASSQTLTLIYF